MDVVEVVGVVVVLPMFLVTAAVADAVIFVVACVDVAVPVVVVFGLHSGLLDVVSIFHQQ